MDEPADDADVEQISVPMRIALAATLVLASVWFVALRPKPVDPVVAEPVPVPAQAEQSTPVEQAEPAKPAKAAKPAASRKATGNKDAAKVLADIKAKRTVVLLFTDGKRSAADDRSVRRAVARVDRHDGRVRVHTAALQDLADYEAVVKDVPVNTSPTVLVIDRRSRARAIEGLAMRSEIDALVDRALRTK